MRVPEKNIKGLSLLELVVVLVLIGVVTAVAYPDFTEWNRERKVRNGTDRVLAFMKNIHAQTERGTFAYVQVLINNNNNRGGKHSKPKRQKMHTPPQHITATPNEHRRTIPHITTALKHIATPPRRPCRP